MASTDQEQRQQEKENDGTRAARERDGEGSRTKAVGGAFSKEHVAMNRRIPSTKEILAWRALNRSVDESWVDWAVSMLETGHDMLHLAILAGATEPFNQFEMIAIVDKTLAELGCDWSDRERVFRDYVADLLHRMLARQITSRDVLRGLMELCVDLGYPSDLYKFYLLYFAQDDLCMSEVQWYWPDATRENIEEIIRQYATWWLQENKL